MVSVQLDADRIDVIYTVEESPRLFAKTGADFGHHDSSMVLCIDQNVAMVIRNAFGNAETLTAKSSYGFDQSTGKDINKNVGLDGASAHHISLAKPINGDADNMLECTAYKSDKNHSNYLGFQETAKGISITRNSLHDSGCYKVGAEAVWRENHSIRDNASLETRNDAGHSLKSSVFHEYVTDTRNDFVFPSKGYYFRLFQELAGFGGNVLFFKNEWSTNIAKAFGDVVVGMGWRMGMIVPFSNKDRPRINDRFLFGGPNSIRGFQYGGIGPRTQGITI